MEKKYLKWYNKIGYGSGDIAGNVVYALGLSEQSWQFPKFLMESQTFSLVP